MTIQKIIEKIENNKKLKREILDEMHRGYGQGVATLCCDENYKKFWVAVMFGNWSERGTIQLINFSDTTGHGTYYDRAVNYKILPFEIYGRRDIYSIWEDKENLIPPAGYFSIMVERKIEENDNLFKLAYIIIENGNSKDVEKYLDWLEKTGAGFKFQDAEDDVWEMFLEDLLFTLKN